MSSLFTSVFFASMLGSVDPFLLSQQSHTRVPFTSLDHRGNHVGLVPYVPFVSISHPSFTRLKMRDKATTHDKGPFDEEFAIATTDSAFKYMLNLKGAEGAVIMCSFLNCFVERFKDDPVDHVFTLPEQEAISVFNEGPTAIPALKRKKQKQTFMDLHVITQSGVRYVVEMQAERHEQFDERCLFYASATYSTQLTNKELSNQYWYRFLRPTIALQILDFDTNRAKGMNNIVGRDDKVIEDKLIKRVEKNPLKKKAYVKDYVMTCRHTGQIIDDLNIIQVELPRSPAAFPPHKNFKELDWWLSLLRYSKKYTRDLLEETDVPPAIRLAFSRLDYSLWNPKMKVEYKEDIQDRETFKTAFLIEREEGKAEGKAEMVLAMLQENMPDMMILKLSKITQEELNNIRVSWQRDSQTDT